MAHQAAFVAIDWGSSRFRAWAIGPDGAPLQAVETDQGLRAVECRRFKEVVLGACGAWLAADPQLPIVLSGMVGSRTGWREAAYVDCPVDPSGLARAATRFEIDGHPAAMLPGVVCRNEHGHADVMRGEELQILGASLIADIAQAVLCIPGTHSKWARLRGGMISGFRTVPTGELFDLLRHRSLVGGLGEGDGFDIDAFARGLDYGVEVGLAAALFSARADTLVGLFAPSAVSAYLSGLLIGAEFAARPPEGSAPLVLMATGVLAERYRAAFGHFGLSYRLVDAREATLAGFNAAAPALWPKAVHA